MILEIEQFGHLTVCKQMTLMIGEKLLSLFDQ